MITSLWYLDGIDVYSAFGVVISKGSADFLAIPSKKDSITKDWIDSDGIEVDLTKILFASREIALQCAMTAESEADFLIKRDLFLNQWRLPGLHRLSFAAQNNRSYFVYYKSCSSLDGVVTLKGKSGAVQVLYKFTLTIVEPEPTTSNEDVFIVTEDGRFLIT